MTFKKFTNDYLSFSRKERLGLVAVLAIMIAVYALPGWLRRDHPFPIREEAILQKLLDTAEKEKKEATYQKQTRYVSSYQTTPNFATGALFRFDPNSLPFEGWKRLGLSDKTSQTICNYTGKGGKFRQPEDLKKIWGLPAGFYERVKDFVDIKKQEYETRSAPTTEYKKFENPKKIISINDADTTAWIALPGIGSKLALRIVNFRNKLGGFYSVEQVRETFGLPDSTFQKIKNFLMTGGELKKIHINSATKDELKNHPYMRWNLANAIIEYRNQHGDFKSLDELKNITVVDEMLFKKIIPYLEL